MQSDESPLELGVNLRIKADNIGSRAGMILLLACLFALPRATAVAELPPCEAPITRSDVRQITRAIRSVTKKPILVIAGVTADHRVPGAIVSQTYIEDVNSGKRTPTNQYTRTDLVSVYMRYTDPAHVDVYTARKVREGWKVESKRDWFL